MTSSSRVELIHELVNQAVAVGRSNGAIQNQIAAVAQGPDERREGFDYLTLIRTMRSEEINMFGGVSNVSFGFPPQLAGASSDEIRGEDGPNPSTPLRLSTPSGRQSQPAEFAPRRRARGRPPWDSELFRQRLAEAETAAKAAGTPNRVAENFVRLDGTTGIDPDSLARLRRRFAE